MTSFFKRVAVALAAVTVVGGLAATPARADDSGRNYIQNDSSIAVGVIHLFDGVYTYGTYDVALRPGQRSSVLWSQTQGFYIGPGYCVQIWAKYFASDSWARNSDICAGDPRYQQPFPVDPAYFWRIVAYRP